MTPAELKKLRKEHGLTQRALGELLGYSANFIARLESEEGRWKAPITQRFEKLVRSMLGTRKVKKVSQTH